jgi:predicted murein hydrolase (TIGR00659 family)
VTAIAEVTASLSAPSSAVWTAATLCAYLVAGRLQRLAGPNPILNPVAVSVALVVAALAATGTSYDAYSQSTRGLQALLGPATVALAVPLYENLGKVRRAMVPLLAAILAGSVTAVASAVLVAWAFGATAETTASLVPKSVTMPIAMAIADRIGGLASLAATFVMLTGIIGAVVAPPLFRLLAIRDERARGVALGVAAHGIGMAQAFQSGQVTGTFAGVAMGLTGLVTALAIALVPTAG